MHIAFGPDSEGVWTEEDPQIFTFTIISLPQDQSPGERILKTSCPSVILADWKRTVHPGFFLNLHDCELSVIAFFMDSIDVSQISETIYLCNGVSEVSG